MKKEVDKRLCTLCGDTLKAIGNKRKNGKYGLKDWPNRCLHKKCWVLVINQHEHNCRTNSPKKIEWAKKFNLRLPDE